MADAIQVLFGGSKAQQTQTPTDVTPPDIEALRKTWGATLSGLLSKGGSPAWGGPFVTPITDAETKALGDVSGAANNAQRTGLLTDTLAGKFLPGQPGANPFLQDAIRAAQTPTLQGLTETLDRALPGRFTAAGQFVQKEGSSPFDRAAAIASSGAAQAISKIATDMSFAGYEAERGRQQQAVPLQQQDVTTFINTAQAVGLPRLIQDLGLERALAEFQSRTQSLIQILQSVAAGSGLTNIASQGEATSTAHKGVIPALYSPAPR